MRTTLPGGTPAELARGSGEQGIALCPDIGGLRPLFDELCAHLASEYGWTVCAFEPFPGREAMDLEERLAAMSGLDDSVMLARLDEAAAMTGCARVAAMGFCMGGMYALKAASLGTFDKAVSFYGMIRVPASWHGDGQTDAIEMLQAARSPAAVLAVIGGKDPWTPTADVDDLEAWGATVIRYPDADHGFVHDPARPAHRPDDAADAWRRVAAFITG